MASQDEPLGDVINLSSDDEPAPSNKRSFGDSDGLPDQSQQHHHRQPKRPRTASASSSVARHSENASSAEEGEIEGDSPASDGKSGSMVTDGIDANGGDQESTSSSCVFMPVQPPVFKTTVSDVPLDFALPVFSRSRHGTWDQRFLDWTRAFCSANSAHATFITPPAVLGGYNFYLDQSSGIKLKKKRSAKLAASEAVDRGSVDAIIKEILPLGGSAQTPMPTASSDQNKDTSAAAQPVSNPALNGNEPESEEEYEPKIGEPASPTTKAVPSAGDDPVQEGATQVLTGSSEHGGEAARRPELSADEIAQLRKYFPSATDPNNICLLCGREGHVSANCSSVTCKFCDNTGHWDFACPTRKRCEKCRQLGHSSDVCVEKLALTKDDGLACCFCESTEHLEDECTLMWRSFVPDAATIRTVVSIPPACSSCGSGQHYSSDCADRHRVTASNPTWSLKNHDRYIDGNCKNLAIEDASARAPNTKHTRAPEPKIRGHAARTANVHYSESDESEVEFLGNKVTPRRAPLGKIRMASNIQLPANPALPGQPPLPPGPPPPGPPPRAHSSGRRPPPAGRGRRPPGPPPNLPSKPPPPSRDYRNVPPPPPGAQQSQPSFRGGRSRGGRGGRGGGRGRGRGK